MVTTFYPPYSYGGDAIYVRALARKLVERGHEVEVIASTDAYRLREQESANGAQENDGVVVHRLETRTGPLAPLLVQQTGRPMLYRRELERLLGRDFDVIHFHNISLVGGPGVLAMGSARLKIYTTHEHWLVCPTHIFWKNGNKACDGKTCFSCSIRSGIPPQLWRYGGYLHRSLEPIDLMLSPSEYTAERHREAGLNIPIRVLPLFSDIAPDYRGAPKVEQRTFIYCGRVTPSKGVEELLLAAGRNPDLTIKIIGDGDAAGTLQEKYSGHLNIHFLGRVAQKELAHHYATASAAILPSIAPETFGLTVVEAAAFGTPAIVSNGSGGAADIVRKSGGGIIYEGEAGLDMAIRQIAADPALRNNMGRKAQAAYHENYTADCHLSGYLELVNHGIKIHSVRNRGAS